MKSPFKIILSIVVLFLTINLISAQDKLDREFMLDDLRKLSHDAAEGRATGTKGAEAARNYIAKSFNITKLKKYNKGYKHEFTFKNRSGETIEGINIIGYVKGEIDSTIVITAHYDHLGIRDSLVYNGADDNASGVAALLAIMDYIKQYKPRHTMIFAALDAEEMGLQGAKALLEDDGIPVENIVLNINMDMISRNNKNELHIAGTSQNPELKPFIEKVNTDVIRFKFGHDTKDLGKDDWTFSSDHGPFHQKGIPFLYFGVEDHEDYHKPTDTYENVSKPFYTKVSNLILEVLLELDKGLDQND
jgi:Zn-dependent M28 family amino/carboxypeptidase